MIAIALSALTGEVGRKVPFLADNVLTKYTDAD
jgi:hypothetical protein